MSFENKYLRYKKKYLILKNIIGGGNFNSFEEIIKESNIEKIKEYYNSLNDNSLNGKNKFKKYLLYQIYYFYIKKNENEIKIENLKKIVKYLIEKNELTEEEILNSFLNYINISKKNRFSLETAIQYLNNYEIGIDINLFEISYFEKIFEKFSNINNMQILYKNNELLIDKNKFKIYLLDKIYSFYIEKNEIKIENLKKIVKYLIEKNELTKEEILNSFLNKNIVNRKNVIQYLTNYNIGINTNIQPFNINIFSKIFRKISMNNNQLFERYYESLTDKDNLKKYLLHQIYYFYIEENEEKIEKLKKIVKYLIEKNELTKEEILKSFLNYKIMYRSNNYKKKNSKKNSVLNYLLRYDISIKINNLLGVNETGIQSAKNYI